MSSAGGGLRDDLFLYLSDSPKGEQLWRDLSVVTNTPATPIETFAR